MSETDMDLQQQLEIHRATLSHYLKQQAIHGTAFTPPSVIFGVRETRQNILRIKRALRDRGIVVEDYPNDGEESKQSQPENISQINILFLAADPSDAARLRLGQEAREIQEKLQLGKLRDRFVFHQRLSVRPEDLSQALLDVKPEIVHFSGHGAAAGALCFEDKLGKVHPVDPTALAYLFVQFAGQVKCVIFNACYSEKQAHAIAEHINYVIGMSQAVGDRAAIAFAIGFYQALGAGRSPEEAYRLGCAQIAIQGIPGYATPVFLKKN